MRAPLTFRSRRARGERGAVAIVIALCLTLMLILTGMVLDFGLVRVDRQVNKSAADAATAAGLHGLSGSDGQAHPYAGVCTALRYLTQNDARFAGVTDSTGTWTDAAEPTATATGNGCTDPVLRERVCEPGVLTTWARFRWTGTVDGRALEVTIQSGYQTSGSGFSEENLPAVQADQGDSGQQGCDQLAVIIKQNRKPGLGSLATSSDLVSHIRTVGRVKQYPGGNAPAMLLLKRTGCPVVQVGSAGAGADSWIRVFGDVSTDGKSQPGTIHADTDGSSCSGGGAYVFYGKAANGIVAYAAPLAASPALPDPAKPGSITSVAGLHVAQSTVRDSLDNVYSSAAINELSGPSSTKYEPSGLPLVTRSIVDDRYLGSTSSPSSGVRGAIADAQTSVFALGATGVNNGNYIARGFTHFVNDCTPTQANVNALSLTSTSRLWVNCTNNAGFRPADLTIGAGTVVFNGEVNPNGNLSLPNASKVYIFGDASGAMSIGTGSAFRMHTTGNTTGSTCSNLQSGSKATLFIKTGSIGESGGGALQLCYTTVFMMGGSDNGCTPATSGTAPTFTPCNGGLGTGQFKQTGGDIDWTAPNSMDVTTDTEGNALPAAEIAWTDKNGPEDLALWSESATSSSEKYIMAGGGLFHVVGVYMVPNADPFTLTGGSNLGLVDAQFIASTLELNGTTQLGMKVDPNAAVTLPKLIPIGLVR